MKHLKPMIAILAAASMICTSSGGLQAADACGYTDCCRAPSTTPVIALGVVTIIAIAAIAAKSSESSHSGHSSSDSSS